jgi:periplasmic divalent cation tolerance protein
MDWESTVQDVTVVLCTVPDKATATRIGRDLVERGLAACVNVVDGVTSVYRWQGKVCEDAEALLVMKTTRAGARALAEAVARQHPYEVPEVIALPVDGGAGPYLRWVRGAVGSG